MNAIELLMVLFLNFTEPCNAIPMFETKIEGQNYRVLRWQCGEKRFRVWQRDCEGRYWSRPFFLEEEGSQQGIYTNQFAELHTGFHVTLSETYVPLCGT